MVEALAEGVGAHPPNLRVPERPIRMLVKLFSIIPYFPLTESRLDAMTGCCRYDSSAIIEELGFSLRSRLEEEFRRYAESIR